MTDEDKPDPNEKIFPKKRAMEVVGVSERTFNKIRDDLKEKFDQAPVLIWDDENKRLASLYSMDDIRKMLELKANRDGPGRKPKPEERE